MRARIGIDRKIKREWLDTLLDQLTQPLDLVKLRTHLDEILREELPGNASRAKSVGIVLRIWGGIPADRVPLRDRALEILPTIGSGERLWLHWGMTTLAYPFFRDVVEVVGRLLALQDDFTTAQVRERVLKMWGDRATTKEAAQKLLMTLVDWEVLRATKSKGHFQLANKQSTDSTALQLWLLEMLLRASFSEEIEAQQLLRLPEAFPFSMKVGVSDLRKNDRLSLHRQGLDMDMVALTPTKVSPSPKTTRKKSKKKPGVVTPSLFEGLFEEAAPEPGMDGTARAGRPPVAKRHEEPDAGPVPSFSAAPEQRAQRVPPIEELITPAVPTSHPDLIPETEFAPQGPLSAPLLECLRLYRDGLEFGCIALAHDLIEAVLRLVCRAKLGPKQAKAGDIRDQFVALCAVGVLPIPLKTRLEQSWLDRIDYQYLLPSRSGDREKLGRIAEGHVRLLIDLERHYFGYTDDHGHVLPHHPEYWPPRRIGNTTAAGSDR